MKLVENKVELIPQEEGLEGIYKQIEKCARTCYKSEDKITEDSAKGFVDRMIKSHHTAMLEHGTVYFYIKSVGLDKLPRVSGNPYSKVKIIKSDTEIGYNEQPVYYIYATTNLRVLEEEDTMHYTQYIQSPSEHYERRYTFKFICSRGVANELVRHRHFSFAQESTRYCNYSKSQFNNELTFIRPQWAKLNSGPYKIEVDTENDVWNIEGDGYYDGCADTPEEELLMHYMGCEQKYLDLLAKGLKPQDAREVLPLGLKTEIVMTGFASDWKDLLDKRLYEKTGKVVPDMLDLMKKLKKVMDDNNIAM